MTKKLDTKNMVITALLIAFGIIIPIAFGFLRVTLPLFTATITAHVPIFVAMFISPASAIFTAIGTAIGFLLAGVDILVTVRAASHIVFAVVGAVMLKKKMNIVLVGAVAAIIHGLCEVLAAYVFLVMGWTQTVDSFVTYIFLTVGLGTVIHHAVDYIIAVALVKGLKAAKMI